MIENNKVLIYLFCITFFVSLLISIFIQIFFIPELFKHKDEALTFAELGLIVPDSIFFHKMALVQLEIINK